jgi:hypothetical protein
MYLLAGDNADLAISFVGFFDLNFFGKFNGKGVDK